MMSPGYNQNGLPYSVERPMVQYIQNLNINNPPYVPQYDGHPMMQSIAPIVSAATCMEIQNKSGKSPLRMFMYNQMSENYYTNQNFDALVKLVLDFIVLGVESRFYPNVDAGIEDAIFKICEMFCANNIVMFPQLGNFVDPQLTNALNATVSEFRNIQTEIVNMKNMMRGNNYQQNNRFQQNNQNLIINQGNQNNFDNRGSFGNMGMPQVRPVELSSSLFSRNNQQGVIVANGAHTVGSGKQIADVVKANRSKQLQEIMESKQQPIYIPPVMPSIVTPVANTQLKQPYQNRDVNMNNQVSTKELNEVSVSNEVLAKNSKLKWTPPKDLDYHYYPAHNVMTHDLVYYLSNEGNNEIIAAINVSKDYPLMDQERHKITTVFGPVPKDLNLRSSSDLKKNVGLSIAKLNIATMTLDGNLDNVDEPEITKYVHNNLQLDTSLTDAWIAMHLCRQVFAGDDKPVDAYRSYFLIPTIIFDTRDDNDVLETYSNLDTFTDLSKMMTNTVNDVGVEFWNTCNVMLTSLVNRLIKEELGIPKLTISDFVLDIADLIDHIGNKYGNVIKGSLLRNQSAYIKQTLFPVFKDLSNKYLSNKDTEIRNNYGMDRFTGKNPLYLTCIGAEYSLTYLDCISHELNIDLSKDVSSVLSSQTNAYLYDLLDGMFNDLDKRGTPFIRCLIKTKDGRILSATRGLIDGTSYLLTLVQ